MSKGLKRSSERGLGDAQVTEMLDKVCNQEYMRKYEYSPPQLMPACQEYVSDHGELLENEFRKPGVRMATEVELRSKLCKRRGVCTESMMWKKDSPKDL